MPTQHSRRRRKQRVRCHGNAPLCGLNVFYRKNTAGQITGIDVQEPGTNKPVIPWVTGLAYTALGQVKSWNWTCANAPVGTACDKAARSFDANGRLSTTEFSSYQFDAAGRITGLTQNLWAQPAAAPASASTPATPATASAASLFVTPITWSAGYDARDRLTSFNRPAASTSYTFDANSNRISAIDTTTSDTDLDGDFDQSDYQKTSNQALTVASDSNRLLGFTQTQTTSRTNTKGKPVVGTTSTQVNYTLDANGNLTGDGLRQFSYDAANRLSQVQVGNTLEASKISYLHNTQGLRVFKSEPQVAQTAPDEEELGASFTAWLKKNFGWLFARAQANATLGQSFVYDDGVLGATPNLLGEYGNGGAKSAGRIEYIWLPTESGQAIPIGLYRNGRFYAIHTDHLGTPRLITDDANKPVWQWAYSAFGDNKPTGVLKATTNPKAAMTNVPTLLKATNPAITVNLRFPGQYADEESNLFENGFRSYRPGVGSYSQPDPLGLAGGLNRFGYVGGNPLSQIDPLGLDTTIVINTNGIGHTGVIVGSGADAVLYDPGGSYRQKIKGSGDTLDGKNARVEPYVKYQKLDGPKVEVITISTTPEQEAEIKKNIDEQSGCIPGLCATCTGNVLRGVGPFKNLPSAYTPGGLSRALTPPKPSPFVAGPFFR